MLKLLTSLLALSLSVSFLPAVQVASFWTNTNTPGISGVTNDTASVNLGLKFSSDVSGTVTGVRFYKGTGNTGTHIGSLWSSSGSLLASVTFANETASGWQQANFASPISITANTVYTISYLAPRASYAQDQNYAWSRLSTAPLHVSGSLPGVFTYSAHTALPVSTWNASNYYVDVVFTPNVTAPNTYTISGHVSGTTAALALSGTSTASTTTDDAGNYTFVGLTSGSYSVTPKQQGYTFSPSATTVPVSTANVTGVNFAGTAASTTALSVTTYGAKGEGVTDDTAAIQKALSAAAGKTLNFPKP